MVGFLSVLCRGTPEDSDIPSATSRGKGIKLREGLSSRSEFGKTGPAGEGQYNGWREPDG
jgi:hypothetical protein